MIFGMLQNTKTNRFHPILFRQAPMPGGADLTNQMQRYKSYGHHTEGFDTREQADAHVTLTCAQQGCLNSGASWEWDGAEMPAMVEFFDGLALAGAAQAATATATTTAPAADSAQ